MKLNLQFKLRAFLAPLLIFFLLQGAHAQVGIGTNNPDNSAILDLTAKDKGFLTPRMNSAQRIALSSPAKGLLVFDNDSAYFFYYNGSSWKGLKITQPKTYISGTGITVSGSSIAAQNTTAQWNANQIQGISISAKTPTNSQVLKWYSSINAWAPGTDTGSAGLSAGTGITISGSVINSSWTTTGSNIYNNNSSNVGIGKSGPSYKLDVNGPVNADSILSGGTTVLSIKGSGNFFAGQNVAKANTGINNLFIGNNGGKFNSGNANLFLGNSAGINNTASNNTFLGNSAGYTNTSGSGNQFEGYYSGFYNTTGSNNCFSGQQAGYNNTTGNYNQFMGNNAGMKNTTGSYNHFEGMQAGYNNTTGTRNVYNGHNCAYNNVTGAQNEVSGYQAGFNGTSFSYSVIHGYQSGYNSNGYYNTFVGYNTGYTNTSGYGNTCLGNYAGFGYNGSHNTFLGDSADASLTNLTNATAIGYSAKVGRSNSIVLGGTAANAVNVGIGINAPTSTISINGSIGVKRTSVSSSYTATNTDYIIGVTTTSSVTITLPDATGFDAGREYIIKAENSSASITISTTSSQTIDGASSKTISSGYGVVRVYSNGISWMTY